MSKHTNQKLDQQHEILVEMH